ncbi:ATP-dependent helicase [bacterium]|nr:ATP-dependent helicase [bacterium]
MLAAKDRDLLKQLRMRKISELVFDKDSISQFNNGLLNNVKDNLTIDSEVTEIELPTKPKVKLYFDISYSKLKCDIILDYKGSELNYFDKVDFLRDIDYEKEVVTDILNYNFVEDNNSFIMTDDDDIYYFLDEVITTLKDKYEIFTSKRIDNTKVLKNISTSSNFSIGQDGIMSYKFNVDGIKNEDLNSLFSALKQKKKYYKLKNNNVVSLENNEELEQLNNLISDLDLSKNDILEGDAIVPKYRAIYIDSLKNSKYKNIETNNLFDEFISNFKKYKNASVSFDEEDKEVLRDYQKDGVKWLNTIYKCDLGGILADEMGLGKSLQTITFIKQILKEKPLAKIIIVVPTALVYNWEKEFSKFAPQLKYVAVSDTVAKRQEIFANKDKYNIFITSYGLIRNDKDEYENMEFELCVVDEAQTIKNYQATMTKEIKKINAKCKIALTGTPVENNVTELWSIFDFIMPGYLNSVTKFREKYNIKDVDSEGLEILNNLSRQIQPFILRRKKKDVVKFLPKKIENKIYIELPDKQKMLYMKELKDTKKEMDEMIKDGGFEKSRMKILQLLMKLRQICIDPSVMYENYTGDRIKIDELLRVVKESIENNHKILIFSSFKRVLDNVAELFTKNKITYYMIDGSVKSKDRMNMVEKFNNDDTNCFLITLKSGGTGLNLTGADTVIHLDIWWNPQVENQATDRAHRIGQTKTVSVIKLVTKGTIEERIIELQDKKKILSENLIEGKNDSASLSSLSEKDIKNLLSSGE